MNSENMQDKIAKMKAIVDPWYKALADPEKAQEIVLQGLLKGYSQTEYGQKYHSENVGSYTDYKKAFPVQNYDGFKPWIDEVLAGNTRALLSEEPIAVGMTRGTTKGISKLIPITTEHFKLWSISAARSLINYVITKQKFAILDSFSLNLANRSNINTMKVGDKDLLCGYSAGVWTKLTKDKQNSSPFRFVPTQQEIDDLGGGSTKEDWEARHELVYQKSKGEKMMFFGGVVQHALYFGRYIVRKHNIYPKDLWQLQLLSLSSSPGINTRLRGPIHALYGKDADILELYSATEGTFGVQIDEKRAWCPCYDSLFFEVQTLNGIKQLSDMISGEIGALIVSTPVLPRYRIGDLILAFEPPYFRCIGRENTKLHPYEFGGLRGKSVLNLPRKSDLESWR